MGLKRYSIMEVKEGRETIFIEAVGYPKGSFREDVRRYANGFLNSHGGVIYFGVSKSGIIKGREIGRKEEDEFRLVVDHVFGSFQPFVSVQHYRLAFTPVDSRYCVIELKVSIGEIGEIYEDGTEKVFVIDAATLIGPLHPQELKELILLKYKQSIEGAEEAKKYCTPYPAQAKTVAKTGKKTTDEVKNQEIKEPMNKGNIKEEQNKISVHQESKSSNTNKGNIKEEQNKISVHQESKSSNTNKGNIKEQQNKISVHQESKSSNTVNSKGYTSKSVTHTAKTVSKETVNDNTNKSNNNDSSGHRNISGIKYGSSTIGSKNIYLQCNPSPRSHPYSTRNFLSSVTPRNSHHYKRYTPYNQNTTSSSNYNHPMPVSFPPFFNTYNAYQWQPRLTIQRPFYHAQTFQPPVQNAYRAMRQLLQYGRNHFF